MIVLYTTLDARREASWAQQPVRSLPAPYRDRVDAMKNPAARARTCAGLALLAQGLEHIGQDASCLNRIGFDIGGRPTLAGGPSFSISHSEQLVACAIANDQVVGLDIEQRRDNISPRLMRRMSVDQETHDAADFFDAWCAREATVKATGRVGLARIRAVVLTGDQAVLDGWHWALWRPALAPGFASCVASDQPIHSADTQAVKLDPAV